MKQLALIILIVGMSLRASADFAVKAFHLDLRIQVMTLSALKSFAQQLHANGVNTLIMEYEATYPFEKHPLVPNRYAYTKAEIASFITFCQSLNIDVIPLQQSFGHVEYILRNDRYAALREDNKALSQICPLKVMEDSLLFTDLYTELAKTHPSPYIHIGCDELLADRPRPERGQPGHWPFVLVVETHGAELAQAPQQHGSGFAVGVRPGGPGLRGLGS